MSDRCGFGLTQGVATVACAGSFFVLGMGSLDRGGLMIPLDGQIVGMALYSVGRMFVFAMYCKSRLQAFFLCFINCRTRLTIPTQLCTAFTIAVSNLGQRFGYTNFGTLSGCGLMVSAIFSLLQYPLIATASNGNAATVNFACGFALLCLTPYCVWLALSERSTPMARSWQSSTKRSGGQSDIRGNREPSTSYRCAVLLTGVMPADANDHGSDACDGDEHEKKYSH